jgi:hypothetical protein
VTSLPRTPDRGWFKSSRSSSNANCVEVRLASSDEVGVRDSKDRSGPVLGFDGDSWTSFLNAIKTSSVANS